MSSFEDRLNAKLAVRQKQIEDEVSRKRELLEKANNLTWAVAVTARALVEKGVDFSCREGWKLETTADTDTENSRPVFESTPKIIQDPTPKPRVKNAVLAYTGLIISQATLPETVLEQAEDLASMYSSDHMDDIEARLVDLALRHGVGVETYQTDIEDLEAYRRETIVKALPYLRQSVYADEYGAVIKSHQRNLSQSGFK